MAKTKEELDLLKKEYETLNNKLVELTDDELQEIAGGDFTSFKEWLEKIGKNVKDITKPILKNAGTVSPEEKLGGKIQ